MTVASDEIKRLSEVSADLKEQLDQVKQDPRRQRVAKSGIELHGKLERIHSEILAAEKLVLTPEEGVRLAAVKEVHLNTIRSLLSDIFHIDPAGAENSVK